MSELLRDLDAYIERFSEFVSASPSSFHAVESLATALGAAGFSELDESAAWPSMSEQPSGFVRRDGALIAWRAGAGVSPTSPVRVIGCHTDSPGFVLKPQPDSESEGWAQVGVEIYGGPLLNSWLDRDLALAGRVVARGGSTHIVRTAPVARIPQLAIHLDREVGSGLKLERQRHTQPVLGVAGHGVTALGLLAREAGVEESELAGWDVRLVDAQPPQRIGGSGELLASPQLDNLSSVFAGLVAMTEGEPKPGTVAVLAAFDHEELGSASRSGAAGPFLEEVLGRLAAGLGASKEDRARALSESWCLSADAGHAVHPNYGEKHDPHVRPRPGAGPMLKINANQRYATDALGTELWKRCCEAAGVPTQSFVSNNDVPCGSTIGPLTATRIGIRTIDAGVPLLSMHSARELAHVDDLHGLARVAARFIGAV